MAVAPLFSNAAVPVRVRIIFLTACTVLVAPVIPPPPAVDLLSADGIITAFNEAVIGLTAGFIINMTFSVIVMAAEQISFGMGLGFATMTDPTNGIAVPVLSQFLLFIGTLIFLSIDGHLLLIEILAQSFHSLPVGQSAMTVEAFNRIVGWGSDMFAGALMLSLPGITVLLLLNLIMGIMTRAAPQLNIFSVGFSVTLMLGFVAVWLITLPAFEFRMSRVWSAGFAFMRELFRVI